MVEYMYNHDKFASFMSGKNNICSFEVKKKGGELRLPKPKAYQICA